ncbi:hypothetical protein K438DRAFT_1783141 [Mycena galopus ATCC 62051]|nr:hypothetical protein K438DRAFT_1783141 [Mycena galopus ATCC 62051]
MDRVAALEATTSALENAVLKEKNDGLASHANDLGRKLYNKTRHTLRGGFAAFSTSGDGTTIRRLNFEAKHVPYLKRGEDIPGTRMLDITSAPNHTSASQLAGWKNTIQNALVNTYNGSPLGQSDPIDLDEFIAWKMLHTSRQFVEKGAIPQKTLIGTMAKADKVIQLIAAVTRFNRDILPKLQLMKAGAMTPDTPLPVLDIPLVENWDAQNDDDMLGRAHFGHSDEAHKNVFGWLAFPSVRFVLPRIPAHHDGLVGVESDEGCSVHARKLGRCM